MTRRIDMNDIENATREELVEEVIIQQDRAERHASFLNTAHNRIRELEKELAVVRDQIAMAQGAMDSAIHVLENGQVRILAHDVPTTRVTQQPMRIGHTGEGHYPQGNDVDRGATDEQIRDMEEKLARAVQRPTSEPIVGYGGTD